MPTSLGGQNATWSNATVYLSEVSNLTWRIMDGVLYETILTGRLTVAPSRQAEPTDPDYTKAKETGAPESFLEVMRKVRR